MGDIAAHAGHVRVDFHVQGFHPTDIERHAIEIGVIVGLTSVEVEHFTDVLLIQAPYIKVPAALGKRLH